jgi:hypothetical protein
VPGPDDPQIGMRYGRYGEADPRAPRRRGADPAPPRRSRSDSAGARRDLQIGKNRAGLDRKSLDAAAGQMEGGEGGGSAGLTCAALPGMRAAENEDLGIGVGLGWGWWEIITRFVPAGGEEGS